MGRMNESGGDGKGEENRGGVGCYEEGGRDG